MIYVLMPSLNRPHRIMSVIESIAEATPADHIILWCVSDGESIELLAELGQAAFIDSESDDKRYVTRSNLLARHARELSQDWSDDWVFFGSDDYRWHPRWIEEAMKVGKPFVIPEDRVNPAGTAALARVDILDQLVADDPECVFHSGYLHNFADTEQFQTAHAQDLVGRSSECVVEHLHHLTGKLPHDETYALSQLGWDHDEALFESRRHLWESFGD